MHKFSNVIPTYSYESSAWRTILDIYQFHLVFRIISLVILNEYFIKIKILKILSILNRSKFANLNTFELYPISCLIKLILDIENFTKVCNCFLNINKGNRELLVSLLVDLAIWADSNRNLSSKKQERTVAEETKLQVTSYEIRLEAECTIASYFSIQMWI